MATIEQQKTVIGDIPPTIQSKIKNEIQKYQESKREKELREHKKKQNENEIKSKTYDLKQQSPEKYRKTVESLRKSLKKYFEDTSNYYGREKFPSFATIDKTKEKYSRFTNIYSAYYSNEDHSREAVNYGNVVMAGSRNIRLIKDVKLIDGDDTDLKLFKEASIYLPTIELKGYEVMTKAEFNPLKVDFVRGITRVKIKDGKVEFKKHLPADDLQHIISEKLKDYQNGTYVIKYEVFDILGEVEVVVKLF